MNAAEQTQGDVEGALEDSVSVSVSVDGLTLAYVAAESVVTARRPAHVACHLRVLQALPGGRHVDGCVILLAHRSLHDLTQLNERAQPPDARAETLSS